MTDDYLTTVLEEAEHVAEQHDKVARTTDNRAHEYLRYAVLRLLEGEAEHLPADWTPIDDVTVGYGSDEAMFDQWGCQRRLVGNRPAARSVYTLPGVLPGRPPDGSTRHRRCDGCAGCLARLDWERSGVRLLRPSRAPRGPLPVAGKHPVEEVLHKRISGPAEAVAPDGGRWATFAVNWS